MLCHKHHKEADNFNSGGAESKEYRQRLLIYTLRRATVIGWEYTEIDKKFLEEIFEDVVEAIR